MKKIIMLFSGIAYGGGPDLEKINNPIGTTLFKISFGSTCNDEENSKHDSFLLFGTMHSFPRYAYPDTVQKHLKQATFVMTEGVKAHPQAKAIHDVIFDLNQHVLDTPSENQEYPPLIKKTYIVLKNHIKRTYHIDIAPTKMVSPLIMEIYLDICNRYGLQFFGVDETLMTLSYHALDQRLADFSHLLEPINDQSSSINPCDLLSLYRNNNDTPYNIITFTYYGTLIDKLLLSMKKNNQNLQSMKDVNSNMLKAISNLSYYFRDFSDKNGPGEIEIETDENSSGYILGKIRVNITFNSYGELDLDDSPRKRRLIALKHAVRDLEFSIKKSASTKVSYSECPEASNLKNRNIDWLTCTLIPILFKKSPSCNQQETRLAAFGAAHLLGRDPDAHENVWGILDFFMDLQNSNRTDYWKSLIGDEKIWFDTDFVNNVKVERLFIDGTWRSDGLVDLQPN